MKISNEQFHRWKHDVVTEEVLGAIRNEGLRLRQQLLEPAVIMGPKENQARVLGFIEGISLILNIKIDDVEEETNEDTPSGSQDISEAERSR